MSHETQFTSKQANTQLFYKKQFLYDIQQHGDQASNGVLNGNGAKRF
jgi:hypothetical protein